MEWCEIECYVFMYTDYGEDEEYILCLNDKSFFL